MAAHSSILAWRICRTEEPGGWQRVGHDSVHRAESTGGRQAQLADRTRANAFAEAAVSVIGGEQEGQELACGW